jgi:allantoicase
MDGWESRRRRGGGFDHLVIQLGTRGDNQRR